MPIDWDAASIVEKELAFYEAERDIRLAGLKDTDAVNIASVTADYERIRDEVLDRAGLA